MNLHRHLRRFAIALCLTGTVHSAEPAIHSGVAWFDQNRKMVSAHGAGILKEGDRFYLFGEFKRDGGNGFAGFSCYSSTDLANWKFERIALPVQKDGRAGPGRVGERPKVLKCPKTGEFVMFFHSDDANYKDPAVAYATSRTIDGEFTFHGPLLFGGKPIKKWDMSAFRDDDDSGYVVTHSGNLYRLADDYRSVTEQVVKDMTHGCEAPAIFKRDGLYYWLGSGLTSWERNDNYYFTAKSLSGPWEKRGNFAPEGKLTWNSQTTFVLPVAGSETTTYLFMGDRWAHPYQNSAATYVWQPLAFDAGGGLSLPEFHQGWKIDTRTGRWSDAAPAGRIVRPSELGERLKHSPDWKSRAGSAELRSDVKDAPLSISFTGTQVGLYGTARNDGGFGRVELKNDKGELVLSTIAEFYCLYEETSLKFLSPKLDRGDYTLTVTPLGEHFFWQAKKASYGSKGDFISVEKVHLVE